MKDNQKNEDTRKFYILSIINDTGLNTCNGAYRSYRQIYLDKCEMHT